MKRVLLFILCTFLIGLGGSFGYADQEEAGSSTNTSQLAGIPNPDRTPYTNVQSGRTVTAAIKADRTDAQNDRHPFQAQL